MTKLKDSKPQNGAIEFEGDWTGVFIRGEDVEIYRGRLQEAISILKDNDSNYDAKLLEELLTILNKTNPDLINKTIRLKPYHKCVKKDQVWIERIYKDAEIQEYDINPSPKYDIGHSFKLNLSDYVITDRRPVESTWEYRIKEKQTGKCKSLFEQELLKNIS